MSIPLISKIKPQNNGAFPVYEDVDGQGGYQTRVDETDRNSIPALNRKEGMLVYTQSDGYFWQLIGGVLDTNWQQITIDIPGPTGPAGPPGPIGPTGPTGPVGPAGSGATAFATYNPGGVAGGSVWTTQSSYNAGTNAITGSYVTWIDGTFSGSNGLVVLASSSTLNIGSLLRGVRNLNPSGLYSVPTLSYTSSVNLVYNLDGTTYAYPPEIRDLIISAYGNSGPPNFYPGAFAPIMPITLSGDAQIVSGLSGQYVMGPTAIGQTLTVNLKDNAIFGDGAKPVIYGGTTPFTYSTVININAYNKSVIKANSINMFSSSPGTATNANIHLYDGASLNASAFQWSGGLAGSTSSTVNIFVHSPEVKLDPYYLAPANASGPSYFPNFTVQYDPGCAPWGDNLQFFGDGYDGDIVVSGTISLTRDTYYHNVSFASSGTNVLITNGYRVFVSGKLDMSFITTGGIWAQSGENIGVTPAHIANAGNGANAPLSGLPGPGGAGGAATPGFYPTVGVGLSGGGGETGYVGSPSNPLPSPNTGGSGSGLPLLNGGNGGAGGFGGTSFGSTGPGTNSPVPGGGGGPGGTGATNYLIRRFTTNICDRGAVLAVSLTSPPSFENVYPLPGGGASGGGGGAGGGNGSDPNPHYSPGGGGGGCGGGIIWMSCALVINPVSGTGSSPNAGFYADGGAGGNGGNAVSTFSLGGAGGGGGGGGGWIYFAYGQRQGGISSVDLFQANGGPGGDGSGGDPSTSGCFGGRGGHGGDAGRVTLVNLGTSVVTEYLGTAGSASSVPSGFAGTTGGAGGVLGVGSF